VFYYRTISLFVLYLVILCLVCYFLFFGCQYQCNGLSGKTCLGNDLLCVEWDVTPYTLTHSLLLLSLVI